LLNVYAVHEVRQVDIKTVEPFVPELSIVEVEIVITNLRRYKSLCTDHIPAELLKAGGETNSEVHKLICSIWNKEELPQQWKESIIVPVYKKIIRLIVIIIEESPAYQLLTKVNLTSSLQITSICQ
jgi:hypothetical protein